jgi:hypothetical protein
MDNKDNFRRGGSRRDPHEIEHNWNKPRHLSHAPPAPNRGRALGEAAAVVAYAAWLVLMALWLGRQ